MPDNMEVLIKELSDRVEVLGDSVNKDTLRANIREIVTEELAHDEEFVRKMRFGNEEEPVDRKLVGTKYARHGLGLADVEFLYDLQESLRGLKRVSEAGVYDGPSEELRNTFGAISDAVYMPMEQVREMDKQAIDNVFPRLPLRAFSPADRKLAQRGDFALTQAYQNAIRAMDTAESGYGSQLIGAQYVGDLWEAARPMSRVFSLLNSFEMQAPTAYLPVEAGLPEMLYVSENTASDASNYSTSKTGSQRVTVSAKKFIIHEMWSGEMEEDSIIPFIPFLRRQATRSIAHYSDSAVLNGDTTDSGATSANINYADGDIGGDEAYLAFDGLRHVALVDNTGNQLDKGGVAVTFADFLEARGRMLDRTYFFDWGHPEDPNQLVYVVPPEVGDQVCQWDEVITADKYGALATVLTGEVAKIGRHPLISSIALAKTYSNGTVTASGNNYGQVVTFNRGGFVVGWRRRIKLETERIPATDQTRLVYSLRMGFGRYSPTGAASGIEAADVIYDIGL